MLRLTTLLLALAICIQMAGQVAHSGWSDTGAKPGSLDYDMQGLRNELAPNFTSNYGNHIQYIPGIAVWGLKACGVESRSGWGEMAVAHAGGAVASFLLDHGGKMAFKRMRPDGSRANSFPSGHSTTAFLTATWLQKEYGDRLPWLCGIGYGMATMTAHHRMLRNKHWYTDTMAGAILGIASAEFGYWVSDRIFGNGSYKFFDEFSYDTDLKYWDVCFWYSRRLAFDGRHGAAATLQVQAPLGAHWGLALRGVTGNISDSRTDYGTRAILSSLGGAYYVRQIGPKAEIGGHALAGACGWNSSVDSSSRWRADSYGLDIVAGVSASYVLTQSSKVRAIAEWETIPAAGWLNCVNLGLGGSIYF